MYGIAIASGFARGNTSTALARSSFYFVQSTLSGNAFVYNSFRNVVPVRCHGTLFATGMEVRHSDLSDLGALGCTSVYGLAIAAMGLRVHNSTIERMSVSVDLTDKHFLPVVQVSCPTPPLPKHSNICLLESSSCCDHVNRV